MKTINDYLDLYAHHRHISSDYAIAKDLDVSKQAVSRWRHGQSTPDIEVLWTISQTTRVPLERLIATAEAERAERAGEAQKRNLWASRLRDMRPILSVVFIGVFALQAAALPHVAAAWQCILC